MVLNVKKQQANVPYFQITITVSAYSKVDLKILNSVEYGNNEIDILKCRNV